MLEQLADEQDDELAKLILKYRGAAKLKSTYIDALLERVKENPRISTTFSLIATNTGRLASSNPIYKIFPFGQKKEKKFGKASLLKKNTYCYLPIIPKLNCV